MINFTIAVSLYSSLCIETGWYTFHRWFW